MEGVKTSDEKYSLIQYVKNVEDFKWYVEVPRKQKSTNIVESYKQQIENIEAIYINPRWKKSEVGEFLTDETKYEVKKDLPLKV